MLRCIFEHNCEYICVFNVGSDEYEGTANVCFEVASDLECFNPKVVSVQYEGIFYSNNQQYFYETHCLIFRH